MQDPVTYPVIRAHRFPRQLCCGRPKEIHASAKLVRDGLPGQVNPNAGGLRDVTRIGDEAVADVDHGGGSGLSR